MIMVMLLVRSAPGVCSISWRLISVTGVGESDPISSGWSTTSTLCAIGARSNWNCNSGALLDTTVTGCTAF